MFIVRVILTTVDDRFPLVLLYFALFNEFFFLYADAVKQDGGGLVVWVLRDKFTTNGEIENMGFY